MSTAIDWHPEDPTILANPYPIFERMRDEDPCHWSPRLRSWVLTRYDDIKAVCLDKDRLSSDRLRPFFETLPGPEAERIGSIMRYLSLWMVFKDPPEPTRLRRLISDQIGLILRRSVDPDRPLSEYGVDSLGALELRTRIEAETGIRLSSSDLAVGTVRGLADLLCEKLGGTTGSDVSA